MPGVHLHSFLGTRYTTSELAEICGVPAGVLRSRIRNGWTIEQAMSVPTIQQRRRGVFVNSFRLVGTGEGTSALERSQIDFQVKANS